MSGELEGTFVGNLTADPEQRTPQGGGNPFTTFRVAVTPRVKRGSEFVDGETFFIGCTAFGRMGANVLQSLRRGSRVLVKGRVSTSTSTRDGQNTTFINCVVDACGPDITFTPARHVEQPQQQPQQQGWQGQQQQQAPQWAGPPQGGQQPPQGGQQAPQSDPWATAGDQPQPGQAPW